MKIDDKISRGLLAVILAGASASTWAQATTVSMTASPNPVVQGSPLSVNVRIANVSDLYGFQFTLSFNPAVLRALTVTEGAFLPGGGSTFFSAGTIDNTVGRVSFVFDSLVGAIPGVSGNGTLASFSFATIGVGSSVLSFSDTLLLNSALLDIPASFQPLTVSVSPIPEPASVAMFALGLAGLAAFARRRAAG